MNIIEGAYSHHPYFGDLYDLRILRLPICGNQLLCHSALSLAGLVDCRRIAGISGSEQAADPHGIRFSVAIKADGSERIPNGRAPQSSLIFQKQSYEMERSLANCTIPVLGNSLLCDPVPVLFQTSQNVKLFSGQSHIVPDFQSFGCSLSIKTQQEMTKVKERFCLNAQKNRIESRENDH